ncbi:MAG: hypothetical protein V2I33_23770 [Kangiellaceae bacterium]|jgi:hypothetical protein|nr:hypothetical protein [Kangiellaceae bacterium]
MTIAMEKKMTEMEQRINTGEQELVSVGQNLNETTQTAHMHNQSIVKIDTST